MADIYYDTTGSFSALTPYKVVAGAYAPVLLYSSFDALNTARYQAFTPSEAATCTGAVVCIKNQSVTGSDNVTVQLQQNTGSWVDVAGAAKTLTVTELAGAHTAVLRASPAWLSFIFTTPAAITTDASTWRIKISSNTANIGIYTTYGYAILTSTTTSYSSGDNIIIKDGVIITQDQSITATNLVLGVNCHWLVPSTVAASYSLNATSIYISKDFRIAMGEDTNNRIPYANQFYLNITNWNIGQGYSGGQNYEFEAWGEKPTSYFTTLSANAAASQKVLVTTDDMSSTWVAPDVLIVTGYNSTTIGYTSATISSIAGTSVTVVTNLAAIHFSKWAVINKTRAICCGIKMKGLSGSNTGYNSWVVSNVLGVYCNNSVMNYFYIGDTTVDTARRTVPYVDTYICDAGAQLWFVNNLAPGTFKNIFVWGGASINSAVFSVSTANVAATYSDIYISSPTSGYYGYRVNIAATNSTITNLQCSGNYAATGYVSSLISFIGCTVTGLKMMGGPYPILASVGSTFNTSTFDKGNSYGVYVTSAINTTFTNSGFGSDAASGIYEIAYASSGYCQIIANNCTFSSEAIAVGNISNAVLGSFFKAHTYGTTANNHISWWNYGKLQSTGTGLTDTTVHTAGGFALRFEPLSSATNHTWTFDIPTGNIQNETKTIAVWVKINSATYYAGTHTNPTLTVNYDNGTTTTSPNGVATDTTAWQLLSVTFTPATTYGQITITLSGATDATTTNAYFYIDDFTGGSLVNGSLDLWANALPVSPVYSFLMQASDFWDAQSSAHVGTGTTGKMLKSIDSGVGDAQGLILSK